MSRLRTGAATRLLVAAVAAFAATVAACGGEDPKPATLVFTDVNVWTGDPEQPRADAVAVRGDRIAAVGSVEEIAALIDETTRIVSAPGAMLVPGFIDAHVHFADSGAALTSVQLRDAATPDEFVARIAAYADGLDPGEWVLGGAWDHTLWGGELPARDWIDAVTPDNPVWISRLDGHMGLANSLALELAGVDADTGDIEGGEIVRDADGRPTGILKDNAMVLVRESVPAPGDERLEADIGAAMRHVAKFGVTTVHDMAEAPDAAWTSLAAHRRLHERGALTTRIRAFLPLPDWQRLAGEVAEYGRGDEWLATPGLKGFMDGSLGSHTAAFFEPYTDTPGDRGLLLNELADMQRWIDAADEAGLQLAVHAIGDRAIAELLDIYGRIAADNGARDRRFRIEHAQHIAPADLDRFASQDVIASVQPYHAIDDGRWAEAVIGAERTQTTYPFDSLLESGAPVAFGSDWYVAPVSPLLGIYAAATRRTLDDANPEGWIPAEKVSVDEALVAYTRGGAHAAFDEDELGMIRPGMLADLALIDRDLTAVPAEEIREAGVLMTVVGGRIVHEAD